MNTRIHKLRTDLKDFIDQDPDLTSGPHDSDLMGAYRDVRLKLLPEGVGMDLDCSFRQASGRQAMAAEKAGEYGKYCDKEAEVVLQIRRFMARHELSFATHPVQL